MKRRAYIFFAILLASVVQMRAQQMAVAFNDGGEVKFEESHTSSKITFSNGKTKWYSRHCCDEAHLC